MVSVLILDGFSDAKHASGAYIPFFEGLLWFSGVKCRTVTPDGFERIYSVFGKTADNIIYVPRLSESGKQGLSFIYTDSTSGSSASFRIASALRERRSENGVVFVNPLCEGDPLASYSPVIVDDICVDKTDAAGLYSLALDAACSICSYYGISVKEA